MVGDEVGVRIARRGPERNVGIYGSINVKIMF